MKESVVFSRPASRSLLKLVVKEIRVSFQCCSADNLRALVGLIAERLASWNEGIVAKIDRGTGCFSGPNTDLWETKLVPVEKETNLGKGMMESSTFHRITESASDEDSLDLACHSPEIPLMVDKEIKSEERITDVHSANEVTTQNSAGRHRTVSTLNGMLSGGNSPEVPSNMGTDLDHPVLESNVKEEIFECPYCGIYSTRSVKDTEFHIKENHSDKIVALPSGCALKLNRLSLENVFNRKSSSEEATSRSVINTLITECCADDPRAQSASTQVISDGAYATIPLQKETDFKGKKESAENVFKCAFCNTVSNRLEDIELHTSEKHSGEIGALRLSLNVTSFENSPHGVCSSDEAPSNPSNANDALLSSTACQTTEYSSNLAISDGSGVMVPQSEDAGFGDRRNLLKCAYRDMVSERRASNPVISDGNSSEVTQSEDAGFGDRKNLFKCAHCDKVSERRADIESHVQETHFPNASNLVVSDGNASKVLQSKDTAIGDRRNLDVVSERRADIESRVQEKHFSNASNLVISDGNASKVLQNKNTGLGDRRNLFKCAHCDVVSNRRADIECHVQETHFPNASNLVISDGNASKVLQSKDTAIGDRRNLDVVSERRADIESRVQEKHFSNASNLVISDGNASKILKSNDTATGDRGNLFKCAHCDVVSKRRADIESHVQEKHFPNAPNLVISDGNSSKVRQRIKDTVFGDRRNLFMFDHCDEVSERRTDTGCHVQEKHFLNASNPIISDGNSSTVPQSKDAGFGGRRNLFKCAYCDEVSENQAYIESHIQEKHLQNAAWKTNNSSESANRDAISGTVNNSNEIFKCAYCHTFSKQREEIDLHIREVHFPDSRATRESGDVNAGVASSTKEAYFSGAQSDKVSRCREKVESHETENHARDSANTTSSSFSEKRSSCEKAFSCQEDLSCHPCESTAEARFVDRQQPASTSFKFECPTCPAFFHIKSLFLAHQEDCKLKVKCPYCGHTKMRFTNVYHLLEHVVRDHENEDPSDLVPESAVTEASEDATPGKFKCCYCQQELDTVKSLALHWVSLHNREMKANRQNGRVKCWICQKELHSKKTLKRHIQAHTGEKTVPCDHCDRYFATAAEQRHHMKSLNLEKRLKCEQCGKAFKRKHQLDRHLICHGSERPYQCPHCPRSFKFNNKLKEHLRVHTGEKPYECRYFDCEEVFAFDRQRRRHELMKHDVGRKDFKCDECSKIFNSRVTWRIHMRKHLGDVIRCDKCPFVTVHKANMDIHYNRHTGEKPYKCDHCPMRYSQQARLTIHLRTHSGEKPFSCDQCDKAFIDSYSLKRHQRTHTGEKPYKCNYCSKSFAQGCQRQFHERTHTGEKPYECSQCDKKFTRRQELNKHITTHEKAKRAFKSKRKESTEVSQRDKRLTRSKGLNEDDTTDEEGSSEESLIERRITRSQGQLKLSEKPEKENRAAKRKREESCGDPQPQKRCIRSQDLRKMLATQQQVKSPAKMKLKEKKGAVL